MTGYVPAAAVCVRVVLVLWDGHCMQLYVHVEVQDQFDAGPYGLLPFIIAAVRVWCTCTQLQET